MLLPTFAQAKTSRIAQVASCDPASDEFRSLVNEGIDLLLQRGDWPGTVVPMRFQVIDGCIVWPRLVQRVRRINHCHWPLKVGNIFHDYVDRNQYAGWCGQGIFFWGGAGFHHHGGYGRLDSQGRVPIFNDVPTVNPQYIRAYALAPQDVGKTVTIFGIDANGNPLDHLGNDGFRHPGLIITLAVPFGQSSLTIGRIDAVQKDVTQKRVGLYAYDTVTALLTPLAMYDPDETNPSYAKDRLFSRGHKTCLTPFTVITLIKLAFVPVIEDSDYIFIPSLNALKFAVQSIKKGEANDVEAREQYMQQAVNELNFVLNNEEPLYEVPVDEGFMGEPQGIGMQNVI